MNYTRVIKNQIISKFKTGAYTYSTSTKTIDAPYSDYFSVEDDWEIYPSQSFKKENCILIRISYHPVFSKSTFFRSTIEEKLKESYFKDIDQWKLYVKSNGWVVVNFDKFKNDVNNLVLNHGLTQDDSFNHQIYNLVGNKRNYNDILLETYLLIKQYILTKLSIKDYIYFFLLFIIILNLYQIKWQLDYIYKRLM